MEPAEPATANPIPQLWSSSLYETQSHLHRGIEPVDVNSPVPPIHPNPNRLQTLMKSQLFQYFMAIVVVYLVSFITIVAVQPPFAYKKSDDKHETNKFSVSKASLFAFGATALGVIVTIVIHFLTAKNKTS